MEKKPLKPTSNTKPKTTVPDWGIKKVLEQNKKVLDFLNKRK